MLEAALAMCIGGLLGRWVLWPIQMRLLRRQIRLLSARAEQLDHDLEYP